MKKIINPWKGLAQGQKQSRFIAWTFMNDEQRRRFVNRQR